MKKPLKVFLLFFSLLLIVSSMIYARDVGSIMDRFYGGIADIIEESMENKEDPELCVKAVEEYYSKNKMTIEIIRRASERSMSQVSEMVEKYSSMTDDELLTMQGKKRQLTQSSRMLAGVKKYNEALQAFTETYPRHGAKIATMSMRSLPGVNTENPYVD